MERYKEKTTPGGGKVKILDVPKNPAVEAKALRAKVFRFSSHVVGLETAAYHPYEIQHNPPQGLKPFLQAVERRRETELNKLEAGEAPDFSGWPTLTGA